MPNIEDFSAGNIAIRPTETGVESAAAAGRRMGVYGGQVAASYERIGQDVKQGIAVAEQYQEHREINTGGKQFADMTVNKDQSWTDFITGKDIPQDAPNRQDLINQRINNPQAAKQWREQQLEPDLQQFQQGFLTPGGQQWAQQNVQRYRDHMAIKTAADQSSMAGAVVQANLEQATNSHGTAVFNDPSPSNLKTHFDMLSHTIDGSIGSSPTLSATEGARISVEHKQKAEQQLVQAAIQGAILKGGDWKAIANDPAYSQYVKPAENAQFERMEKVYQRGQQVADKQIQLLNKQIAEADQHAAIQESRAKYVKTDEAGNFLIDPRYVTDLNKIAVTSKAPNAVTAANAEINWVEKIQKNTKVVNDPATYSNLRSRVSDTNNPTTDYEVRVAMGDGKIDYKPGPNSGPALLEMIKARNEGGLTKDPQFKFIDSYVKQVVEGSYGGAKYDEDGKYQQAMLAFMNEYNKQKRSPGGLPANALDVTDEKSLIRTTIEPFKQTLQGAIMNNGGGPPPPPVYTSPATTAAAATVAPGPAAPPVTKPVTLTGTDTEAKAAYNKLEPGTVFIRNGKQYTKPRKPVETLAPGQT